MRSFRSAVDFARSSSRECLRRCQKSGLFGPVGNGESATAASSSDRGDEILEYRLFREFCEPPAAGLPPSHQPVRLRRHRSLSYSDSLQKSHSRRSQFQSELVGAGNLGASSAAPDNESQAPSVKVRSAAQRSASSLAGRLSKRLRQCEVVLLDGSEAAFSVDVGSKAQVLLDLVCDFLSVTERQYFGLCYKDLAIDAFQWLQNDKRIGKQLDGAAAVWRVDFAVKFFPAKPEGLTDASARSCLALQVRQCLVAGRLPCSAIGYALLGSYLMQSELGDRDEASAVDSEPAFCPPELLAERPSVLRLARRLHACHAGLASRDAERQLLANARRLAAYGLDAHSARIVGDGQDDSEVLVGVCSEGLVVMQPEGLLRLSRLTWPRVTALNRRGREVRVELRGGPTSAPAAVAAASATVRLRCQNGRLAKRLWRSAVEHHGFFRLKSRDNSGRERIQSGTVRLSRSCSSSHGNNGVSSFAGSRAASTMLPSAANGGWQSSGSLSAKRRAASMNRVADRSQDPSNSRPATLVTPEDLNEAAASNEVAMAGPLGNDPDFVSRRAAQEALSALVTEAELDDDDWCGERPFEPESIGSPMLVGSSAADADGANFDGMTGRFQFNSTSSASRYDSSSTDYCREHEPRSASDLASSSPMSRQPPSGEETPSGQQECDEDKAAVFRSPELLPAKAFQTAPSRHSQLSTDTLSVPNCKAEPAELRRRRAETAAAHASVVPSASAEAAPADSTAKVEDELSRVSIMETRTETTEINEPVEDFISFLDDQGNRVTRKVFRCRTIRRIVTDTVVESPLSAWNLYCQESKVDEATRSAVMEQLRLKRAQQLADEGYV